MDQLFVPLLESTTITQLKWGLGVTSRASNYRYFGYYNSEMHQELAFVMWERNKLFSTLKVLMAGLIIKYTWDRLARENNPTCTNGSEVEREHGYKRSWARNEVRHLEGFKRSLQDDKRNRSLVNRSLSCSIDRSKEVISDKVLWARPLIQIFLGSQREGQKFLLNLKVKLPLAQSSLHTTEAHVEVTCSEPPKWIRLSQKTL